MTKNEQCAEKVGKSVNHCMESQLQDKYKNGQGVDASRASTPNPSHSGQTTVNPFKGLASWRR